MDLDTPGLTEFIERQCREFGGNVEVDTGLWALLGVETTDAENIALARALLEQAPVPVGEGTSEDERWTLFYVDAAARGEAMHWIEDWQRRLRGEVREPTPTQRDLIAQLGESTMPHRLAQKLVEDHAAGALAAGSVRESQQVRALLDRLHLREPLYYAAFQQLLENHLVDLVVLLEKLIPEDVELTNEAVRGGVSRDPFLQKRQDAAAEIRRLLVDFAVINSLDQQRNTAVRNPYAAYFDVMPQDGNVTLPLDGTSVTVSVASFGHAIHSIRRNIYNGGALERFDTQVPWMRNEIAHPFRFVKRQLEIHRGLGTLDGLYMLERAVTA